MTVRPEHAGRVRHGTQQHPGAAVAERVEAVDAGQQPAHTVPFRFERAQRRGADGHGTDARAVAVDETRHDGLVAPGACADLVRRFQERDVESALARRAAAESLLEPAADPYGRRHGGYLDATACVRAGSGAVSPLCSDVVRCVPGLTAGLQDWGRFP
ncbi:hypothetical protein [Streptomyces sp. NPDC046759]|uniref:hypothetical protein n=1 Tax=Streptomyces sp. NPDC046759 TaxID=3155019 RepID=UPI0033E30348